MVLILPSHRYFFYHSSYLRFFILLLGTGSLACDLLSDVAFLRQAMYSDNTEKSYRTHRNARFVPATNVILCMYAAYLARFLSPQFYFTVSKL